MAKILIAEDDKSVAKLIKDWLSLDNHDIEAVEDGAEALNRLKVYNYDLVILDWMLPQITGVEVVKDFRARGGQTPVLLLTGRSAADDKERGLDSGADDYVTKPFNGKELNARIRALLRRPSAIVGKRLEFGGLVLDRDQYYVARDGNEISLVPTEFDLLEFLMRNPNRVFSAEALLSHVWSNQSDATVDAVTTCIKRLRKKIETAGKPELIRTVHRVGYKLATAD